MLRLQKLIAVVKDSRVFRESQTALATELRAAGPPAHVTRVRCLALGSPCSEPQAPYQLAYLVAVAEALGIAPHCVSVYDPVFGADDVSLLHSVGFVVEAPADYVPAPLHTLYYMPHCPRAVTEEVFKRDQPRYVLGNDLSVVIGTLTRAQFLQQFPLLAHMNHIHERGGSASAAAPDRGACPESTFTVVRKRNRKRYVEPELHYDLSSVYCSEIRVVRLSCDPGPWRNSFSDLALNILK